MPLVLLEETPHPPARACTSARLRRQLLPQRFHTTRRPRDSTIRLNAGFALRRARVRPAGIEPATSGLQRRSGLPPFAAVCRRGPSRTTLEEADRRSLLPSAAVWCFHTRPLQSWRLSASRGEASRGLFSISTGLDGFVGASIDLDPTRGLRGPGVATAGLNLPRDCCGLSANGRAPRGDLAHRGPLPLPRRRAEVPAPASSLICRFCPRPNG